MNDYIESTAVISSCTNYRYLLRRVWDRDRIRVLFIMLNPSTADAEVDDPTIKSCVRLCKENNFGALEVVNLFGLRATNPEELLESDDPVGPRNFDIITAAMSRCDLYICAWGAHKMADQQKKEVLKLVTRPAVFCFGLTKESAPKHPLYIKSGTPLVVYA